MNAFEGCCAAADHYYAVWPKHKATNDYTLLLALPCQQYWVRTWDDVEPGSVPNWGVRTIFDEVEKP